MKMRCVLGLLAAVSILAAAATCLAEVEWRLQKELKLDAVPLDSAASPGGQWIFVLTAAGDVQVFSADGVATDKFHVGEGFDGLFVGSQEDILYLKNSKDRSIQIVQLDFIRQFNLEGSPFKGSLTAPLVLVVFTDFQ